ncbi:MAG: carbamoyltransferase C-terminal domain-containing protein, partial [Acidithiobacillales bacterium]
RREMSEAEKALWGIEKLNVPRSGIPAVTHVDYSARLQTVRREANPLYHDILRAFFRKTGCPVVVNTSFNVRGEPIVCTPEDAYRCFMRTAMDALVLENHLLLREEQPEWREGDEWRKTFTLD